MREAGLSVRVDGIGNLRGVRAARWPPAVVARVAPGHRARGGALRRSPGRGRRRWRASRPPAISRGPTGWGSSGFSDEEGVRFGSRLPRQRGAGRAVLSTWIAARARETRTASPSRRPSVISAATRPRSPPTGLDPGRRRRLCSGTSRSTSNRGRCSKTPDCPWASSAPSPDKPGSRSVSRGGRATPGTIPMPLRRDALAAAAEFVVRRGGPRAGRTNGLVATVGRLEIRPGASNVIPGVGVRFARCPQPGRWAAPARLSRTCTPWPGAWRRRVETSPWDWKSAAGTPRYALRSPASAPGSTDAVAAAGVARARIAQRRGSRRRRACRRGLPVAMLFVRCKRRL